MKELKAIKEILVSPKSLRYIFWNKNLFNIWFKWRIFRIFSILFKRFKKNEHLSQKKFYKLLGSTIIKKKFTSFTFYLREFNLSDLKEVFVEKDYALIDDFSPKEGEVVLDLGAGVGDYALFSSLRVGAKGKVISVDADKKSFELLKKNIEINNLNNVIPIHAKVEGIDWLIKKLRLDKLDLIKMDIEGFEYKVLKNSKRSLMKFRPKIIAEIHSPNLRLKVLKILSDMKYEMVFEKEKKRYKFYLSYFLPKPKV
jgi:precorrin-6B methylase 2